MEHLLSALEQCGVDNARIEIEGGDEVPIIDGSALGWVINIQVVSCVCACYQNLAGLMSCIYMT